MPSNHLLKCTRSAVDEAGTSKMRHQRAEKKKKRRLWRTAFLALGICPFFSFLSAFSKYFPLVPPSPI